MDNGHRRAFARSLEGAYAQLVYVGLRKPKSNETLELHEVSIRVQDIEEFLTAYQRAYRRSLVMLGVSITLLLITLALLWTPVLDLFHGTS